MTTPEHIESTLRQALSATEVRVIDESALHAGHAGAASGGGHYRVTVVSPLFTGKNPVQRHRLVYAALADDMQQTVHALALTTLAPHEQTSRMSGGSVGS